MRSSGVSSGAGKVEARRKSRDLRRGLRQGGRRDRTDETPWVSKVLILNDVCKLTWLLVYCCWASRGSGSLGCPLTHVVIECVDVRKIFSKAILWFICQSTCTFSLCSEKKKSLLRFCAFCAMKPSRLHRGQLFLSLFMHFSEKQMVQAEMLGSICRPQRASLSPARIIF